MIRSETTPVTLAAHVRALDDDALCELLTKLPPAVFLELLAAAYPNITFKGGDGS